MPKQYYFSIIVPSRGRPHRLISFLNSVMENCFDSNNFEIIIGLDEDDYHNYDHLKYEKNMTPIRGKKNRTMGKITLDCINKSKGQFLFLCNDDVIFLTKNWDKILKGLLEPLSKKPILAYPNDGIKKGSLCTFPIFQKKILIEHPYILPEDFQGACIDLHIFDIFKGLKKGANIIYIKEIICKHNHYSKYPILFDETYAKRSRFGDDLLFISLSKIRRQVSYDLSDKVEKAPNMNDRPNIFSLLSGSSSISWKIKLFIYMSAKRIYRKFFY